jgi:hypothetical protein
LLIPPTLHRERRVPAVRCRVVSSDVTVFPLLAQ